MKLSRLCEGIYSSDAGFVTPDDIYDTHQNGVVPFIYLGRKLLYSDDHEITHYDLIAFNFNDFSGLDEFSHCESVSDDEDYDPVMEIRHDIPHYHLLGRLGQLGDRHIVSFWNDDVNIFKQLPDCLNALFDHDLIRPDTLVSTPVDGTISIDEAVRRYSGEEPKPEEDPEAARERQELLKQQQELHLMRGDKKAVREKLGLAIGSKKNETQAALEKAGKLTPGHKYWAMHSEGALSKALRRI